MPQRVFQCWMCVYISEFPFLITFVFPCRSLTCVQLLDQRQPSSLRCSILIWTCHFQVSSAVTLRKFDWIFNLYTYYYAQRSITRLTDYFRLTASVLPKLWYFFFFGTQRALSLPTTWTTSAVTYLCTRPSVSTAHASWWSTTMPLVSQHSTLM